MTTDTNKQAALLPCPFCGAGETQIVENGKVWSGMKYSEPTSVSVRHWCQKVEGQPSRMLERIGKDHASAIAAWNQRAAPQGEAVDWQGLTDAEIDDLCPDVWSDWKTHARAIEAKLREKNTAHQPAAGVEVAKPGQCWPESVMQQWDYWRKQIADGDSSSAPRDWFESLAPEPAQPEPQGERATPTESQIEAAGAAFDEYFNSHPFDELTSGKAVAREMLTAALLSAAPAVREPLTDREAEAVLEKHAGGAEWSDAQYRSALKLLRSVEAAHGIGKPEDKK